MNLLKKILFTILVTTTFQNNLNAGETEQKAFIERFYQNILNRTADGGGMNAWLNVIQNQSATRVALGFFKSQEFINKNYSNEQFVDTLYQTLFDRQADLGGKAVWLNKLGVGISKDEVMYGFFNSQEFKNLSDRFGVTQIRTEDQLNTSTTGVDGYVNRFYTLVLNRNADEGGFNNWKDQLRTGTKAGGDIAKGFFNSQEYLNRNLDNSTFLDICYRAFFNREADSGGKNSWLTKLSQGYTKNQILDGFIDSQEFINLANSFGIVNKITTATQDNIAPIFTSDSYLFTDENTKASFTIKAIDKSSISYSLTGTDSAYFTINSSTGVITFKTSPDYEAKISYTFTAIAKDNSNNSSYQNITINILDVVENSTTSLYITSAVYSNNNTPSTNDDILYIYFNKAINESSINTNDISSNYVIDGVGAIGSASTTTYDSVLFRQKIVLNSSSTATIEPNELSTIALKPNGIKSSDNSYPESFPAKIISKFSSVSRLQTGQTTSFATNDDGALKRGISRNFTRDNTNNIVKDLSSGLMWQDDSDVLVGRTWVQAKSYCENINLGGYSDWYLPNMKELSSISNKERYNPSIFSTFQNLASRTIEGNTIYTDSLYWSSTVGLAYAGLPWVVEFGSGGTDVFDADNSYYTRCVHKLVH